MCIVHFGHVELTLKAIASCLSQRGTDITVIVLNNGTEKDHELIYNAYGHRVRLLDVFYNTGFAKGNNLCAQEALRDPLCRYLVLLNNDAEAMPDAIAAMIEYSDTHGMDIVVPLIEKKSGAVDSMGITINKLHHPFNRVRDDQQLFGPTGACFLITRPALEKIGTLFREEFFAYAEDFELGFRAREQGFHVGFARNARIVHTGQAATSYLSFFSLYHTYRNILITFRLHLPVATRWRAYCGLALYMCAHALWSPRAMIRALLDSR